MSKVPCTEVTMSELRENLSSCLGAVESGVNITVTRCGKPSATLVAAQTVVEATDIGALKTFRDTLGVQGDTSAILPLYFNEPAIPAVQNALERDFGQLVSWRTLALRRQRERLT